MTNHIIVIVFLSASPGIYTCNHRVHTMPLPLLLFLCILHKQIIFSCLLAPYIGYSQVLLNQTNICHKLLVNHLGHRTLSDHNMFYTPMKRRKMAGFSETLVEAKNIRKMAWAVKKSLYRSYSPISWAIFFQKLSLQSAK